MKTILVTIECGPGGLSFRAVPGTADQAATDQYQRIEKLVALRVINALRKEHEEIVRVISQHIDINVIEASPDSPLLEGLSARIHREEPPHEPT